MHTYLYFLARSHTFLVMYRVNGDMGTRDAPVADLASADIETDDRFILFEGRALIPNGGDRVRQDIPAKARDIVGIDAQDPATRDMVLDTETGDLTVDLDGTGFGRGGE